MTEDPITTGVDTGLEDAARIMLDNGFRHLPIVDENGRVAGIASLRRVVAATQAAADRA
jgi:CBS domain-containing protein